MPSATLNVVVTPRRALTATEAAHYCGRSARVFKAECPMKPIVFPNGDERFDILDLDDWLISLKARDDGADILDKLG